jgi:hypothetical protein
LGAAVVAPVLPGLAYAEPPAASTSTAAAATAPTKDLYLNMGRTP